MKYKINKGFIVQKLGNKTVIFDGEKSALYTLNESASFIFGKLKIGWDENKNIEGLLKRYSVKREKLEQDYEQLTNDLLKKKIIKKSA